MNTARHLTDGDTRPCPQCRDTLVLSSHYPILTVGMALMRPRSDVGDVSATNGRGCAATAAVTTVSSWAMREGDQIMSTPSRRRKDREPLTQIIGTPATVPIVTGDVPNPVESLAIEPTYEDVARRAYQLYVERGGEDGRDQEDWFQAERELRELALRGVVDRILGTEGPYAAA